MAEPKKVPDQDALKRVGASVRARLQADPGVYKLPTDLAEIYAVGDFLTQDECKRLTAKIDAVARPSELHETAYIAKFRTSYTGYFDGSDAFVRAISRRIDDLLAISPECGETIQGQRYLPGQEFKPHNDWFYTDQEYWEVEKKRGGQRSWTAMAFLNAVEEGGHTFFTKVGASIEPKPGVLMIWNNARPDGTPNLDTLHAGTPVIKGEKYVLTKWYRTRAFA
ncbi:prolyl hydroxylase family protein [Qipengyuania sp.]|uniref:prolyl hydroxylase family protein n=1 Tax=Qipengyuania sp. TaxID=2004515 RepID=UPI0035C7951E